MSIFSLAAIGTNLFASLSNVLVGGSGVGSIFRSGDQGESWTTVNAGLNDLRVRTLTVAEGTLFAGKLGGGMFVTDVTR